MAPTAEATASAAAHAEIARLRETMAWVADKLQRLEALPPHAWDRSSLRALYHALEDGPGIGGRGHTGEGRKGAMDLRGARPQR